MNTKAFWKRFLKKFITSVKLSGSGNPSTGWNGSIFLEAACSNSASFIVETAEKADKENVIEIMKQIAKKSFFIKIFPILTNKIYFVLYDTDIKKK